MTSLYLFANFLFLFVCFLLCVVILLQESKSMGLGSALGGGNNDSLFGTSTADVLKRFTGWLIVVFLTSSFLLAYWTEALSRQQSGQSDPYDERFISQ